MRTDTTNRHQAENIIGALLAYPQIHPTEEMTNPVVGTFPYAGGTIRVYHNGMLDAIDGPTYSVSLGFSRDESPQFFDWLDRQQMIQRQFEAKQQLNERLGSLPLSQQRLAAAGASLGDVKIGAHDEDREPICEGHPAGPSDPMGETVYCDGSCRSVGPADSSSYIYRGIE